MIKPVTKILLGTTVITLLLTLVLRETPEWIKRSNPFRGKLPSMDPCLCCYRFYSHEEEN
ncbi:hypothetical protein OIU77_019829 [Salix suchowensis]|uniref:Uncharacterized protein n=1 Tax=Salix suchowensis TaxID=1278906 RepID=A0ABQ9CHK0_9ROSI|nr:hypothetical protein OIU77_019829 [Salix suchowensis]